MRGSRARTGQGLAIAAALVLLAPATAPARVAQGGSGPAPKARAAVAPSLPTWGSVYDFTAGNGYSGWSDAVETDDPAAYGRQTALGGRPGLWLWLTGDREYRPGAARFELTAPGTTRIASASVRVRYAPKVFAHHCLELELAGPAGKEDAQQHCKPPEDPTGTHTLETVLEAPTGTPASKKLNFRLRMPVCNNPSPKPCSKQIPPHDPLTNGAFLRLDDVRLTLVDDDLPAVAPSGPLHDLDEKYVDGRSDYDLRVGASDPGAGIVRAGLERADQHWLGAETPCDPAHHTAALGSRVCPAEWATTLRAPVSTLPEGVHRFRATTQDPAGNRRRSEQWSVFVDRTPPTPADEFEGIYDTDDRIAHVFWDGGDDPDLQDGSGLPGSGASLERVRYRRGTPQPDGSVAWGPFSATTDVHNATVALPDATDGEAVELEVAAIDAVGNVSSTVNQVLYVSSEGDLVEEPAEATAFSPRYSEEGVFVDEGDGVIDTGGDDPEEGVATDGVTAQAAQAGGGLPGACVQSLIQAGNDREFMTPRPDRLAYPSEYFRRAPTGGAPLMSRYYAPADEAKRLPALFGWAPRQDPVNPYPARYAPDRIPILDVWAARPPLPCVRLGVRGAVDRAKGNGTFDKRPSNRSYDFTTHKNVSRVELATIPVPSGKLTYGEARTAEDKAKDSGLVTPRIVRLYDSLGDPIMALVRTTRCQMAEADVRDELSSPLPPADTESVVDRVFSQFNGVYNVYTSFGSSSRPASCLSLDRFNGDLGKIVNLRIDVQGYGCIKNVDDRSDYQLVSFNGTSITRRLELMQRFNPNDLFAALNGRARTARLNMRGFVRRTVLPKNSNGNSIDWSRMPDPECGGDMSTQSTHDVANVAEPSGKYYRAGTEPYTLGGEQLRKDLEPYGLQTLGGRLTADDGYVYLMVNTTAVRGGGIVRAVVPVRSLSVKRIDWFDYCDPNGAGFLSVAERWRRPNTATDVTESRIRTVKPRATWSYGEAAQRLTAGGYRDLGIRGWLPSGMLGLDRDANGEPNPAKTGVSGQYLGDCLLDGSQDDYDPRSETPWHWNQYRALFVPAPWDRAPAPDWTAPAGAGS